MPVMKSKFEWMLIAFAIFALTGASIKAVEPECDWQKGQPNMMHWPQLPDLEPNGVGVDMYHVPLADDFMCTDSGPVKDIHIWGSFAGDVLPPDGPDSLTFQLSIYSDVPASGAEWSRPGDLLWSKIFHPGEYTVRRVSAYHAKCWYDPLTNVFIPADHLYVYQYNFCIKAGYFTQEQDKIYWLEVQDLPRDDTRDYTFGWMSTTVCPDDLRFNDDAVWLNPDPGRGPLGWLPLEYPEQHEYEGESLDFAFVITGGDHLPPLNNKCSNAKPISGVGKFPFDTTYATFDGPGHYMKSPNIWFCYTATSSCCVTVSLCGSEYNTKLAVYDGCDCYPSKDDMIACNDNFCNHQSQVSFAVEVGNEYLIEVGGGGYSNESGQGVMTISCELWHPDNDDCADAEPIGNVTEMPFDSRCATFDGPGHCMEGPNIWYCYTAACTGCVTVSLCGSHYDTMLAVYSGDDCYPPEANMIACNDDFCDHQSEISFSAVTGDKYLIEIGGFKGQSGKGVMTISCDEWCPDNDDCCNAEPIGNVTEMPFDARCATFDGPGHYMSVSNIWYCYTATCTGQATVSLCGSEFDTLLAIYKGCGCYPAEDDLIASNDNYGSCERQSQVSFDTIASEQYLIEIGGYRNFTGRGVMTIYCEGELPEGLDFGDAPDGPPGSGYPTLLANNGARHIISGPWLGDSCDQPDSENDGQPENNALGDDNDGSDDEDGVYIPPLVQGQDSEINVQVNGCGGIVQAWLDFNSDLSWQASELIYNGFLPDGIHTIPVTVPVSAVPGQTFARFRISSQGGLSPEGLACDGEVEDHKVLIESMLPNIKWPQWPDLTQNGINIRVDSSDQRLRTIADDFECTSGGWITDVHLWGSWKNDIKGQIKKIHLSIHSDDPAGCEGWDPQNLFSQPEPEVLWEKDFGSDDFDEVLYAVLPEPGEWWWDPASCKLIAGGDRKVWRIDIFIDPDEAFVQEGTPYEPIIYWLSVQIETECGQFGWKTRHWPEHYMDDAVWDVGSELPRIWKELHYPPGHPYHCLEEDSIDMAFVITGEQEPMPPKPPIEHIKWSQPPIEQDLISAEPIYCGWDEPSYAIMFINELEGFWRVVADDFRCIGRMPITSIHWWGSYTGWDCPEPPETKPIAWRIGFWSNVPAGSCGLDYSRPRELLWLIDLPAQRVSESIVGLDSFPGKPSDMCLQYNVQFEPGEYFWQSEYLDVTEDDVYWISITAVYPALLPQPFYPWGWKTRPWPWMDDAVTFEVEGADVDSASVYPSNVVPIENDLICGQPQSYDMSFELDTDPNYIKWEQPFTGIRNWQHYEDEKSMAIEEEAAVKWVQLPYLDGPSMVVDATNDMPPTCSPQILADDFLCDASGKITEIQIWGSWWCDILPCGNPCNAKFRLYIYEDVPAQCWCGSDYSKPGQLLWKQEFVPGDFTVELVNENIPEGYYNPCSNSYMPLNHYKLYKYKFFIDPNCAFNQQGSPDNPTIYWLAVQAQLVHPPGAIATRFGWKVSQQHWNDKAVWAKGQEPNFEPWKELKHPLTCEPIDLAFTITTEAEGLQFQRVVADDWKCKATTPVTAITWWGSYIGYRYQACQCQQQNLPVRPDYFMLSIWNDVPDPDPDDPTNYSHPGTKIWQYKADIYDEVLVGYDKHPEPFVVPQDGYEPVFRYSVRLPQDKWFCQEDVDDIYWLSIVAVYKDPPDNIYPWGWTNHKCSAWEPEGLVEVAHWTFDETAGVIAADSSNNDNHCVLFGDSSWMNCCGRLCGAIDLDGDGDYVKRDTTDGLDFAPNSFSVCAWINAREVTGIWRTILEYDRGGHNWFGIRLNKIGKFHFRVGGNTRNSVQILNPDKWYFLTCTYDAASGAMSIYINGQFDSSGTHSSGFDLPVNSKITIGVRGLEDRGYFNGLIDDMRIYDRVLSANEIKELADMGVNDDAVAGYLDTICAEPEWEWVELHDQTGTSEDMSFVLFTEPGCLPCCHDDYFEWLSVGKPDCWCYPRQCHGDADGLKEGSAKKGYYYVHFDDLNVLLAGWHTLEPPYGLGIATIVGPNGEPGICADFAHDKEGNAVKGYYRVHFNDLNILIANWNTKEPNIGPGIDPNCLDCP